MTRPEEIPAIRFERFSFQYEQSRPVLDTIDLTVSSGERLGIFGENGAGKSTLLRSVVGLLKGSGNIYVDGIRLTRESARDIRKKVGLVFQDPQIQLFCPTVLEDVMFGPYNYHGDLNRAKRDAFLALEQVGYHGDPDTPCHHLSLGQMRQVAIAGVLSCEPEIILLDEPDSFLDKKGKDRLFHILNAMNKTLVIVTHDDAFAGRICERSLYMVNGSISYDGPVAGLPLP